MSSVPSISVLQDFSSSPPYEGAEKLMEIHWTVPEGTEDDDLGLRRVPRTVWEGMLDLVRCTVLSVVEGDGVDAYLLSESSMFVWPHKLILKTCGTTTLLLGLQALLDIASKHCGLNEMYRCFYSRKAFMFPERQIGPHKNWDDEVKFLDDLFGKGTGSAYVVGKMNGDHWLLYLTSPREEDNIDPAAAPRLQSSTAAGNELLQEMLSSTSLSSSSPPPPPPPPSSSVHTIATTAAVPSTAGPSTPRPRPRPHPPTPSDQTLEILMTHLDPDACKSFYYSQDEFPDPSDDESQQGHLSGSKLSAKLGIDTLLQGSTIDSFLFTPCGYSANIVKEERYATIHVTPEPEWSYASFECNFDFRTMDLERTSLRRREEVVEGQNDIDTGDGHNSLSELVERVLDIFRPEQLSITLFVSVEESASGVDQSTAPETRTILDPRVAPGYRRTDRILYEFAGYHLLFSTYEKKKQRR